MRFSLEILAMLKTELGDSVEIIVKLNGSDILPGGVTPHVLAASALMLQRAGVSMITVNAGGSHTSVTGMSADGNQEEGWKVDLAEIVKTVVNIPVAACGNFVHPEYVEKVIQEGKCDLAAIGRGQIADPQWVNKVSSGREDEIRPCIACLYCITPRPVGESACSVNPRDRVEYKIDENLNKNGNGRSVVIIGAGPAGLEAAVTLAERGFKTFVYEKFADIGGMMALAAIPIGKQKYKWMLDYYRKQITRLNIEMHYSTEVNIEIIKKLDPYAVIVATGSSSNIPPIKGIDGKNVLNVRTYLRNLPLITGKNIVCIGAGLAGLEVARMLQVAGNGVTVVDMMSEDAPLTLKHALAKGYAKEAGVVVNLGQKVCEIQDNVVFAKSLDESVTIELSADIVLLSVDVKSNRSFFDQICNEYKHVYNVGDSNTIGNIFDAISAGNQVGRTLE